MYKKELEDQQRKVDKYIADGADEWDIKTQVCDFAFQGGVGWLKGGHAAKDACRIAKDDSRDTEASWYCGGRIAGISSEFDGFNL
jgi:hypothetical protein